MFRRIPIAIAIALATPALAQSPERMDQIVASEADTGAFMGAVLVAKGDAILLDKGYGSANLEWGIANSPQAKYRIGSVTKQFTAAAILLLQERGQLDVDAPVKTYWPAAPAAWDAITVRHLLNHTAGIPNVTSFEDFARRIKFLPTTRDALIGEFIDEPLEFAPGEDWKYSNSGYLMLSAIVEEVSGQSYAEFVKTNIFDPLGMNDTAIDVSADIVPMRASGYFPTDNGPANAEYANMAIPQGAGALYSTTHDLLAWQRGLFGGRLLKPTSLAAMTTSDVTMRGDARYGFGVMLSDNEDGRTVWHGGGIEGFNAMLMHDPDEDITVVVLANINGGQAGTLGNRLLKLARGGEVTLASEVVVSEETVAQLEQYEGTFALAPEFKIRMFAEGGKLMTQATGQQAFQLYPTEEADHFFLKVVDARVRFNRDDSGEIVSITLFQGGREMVGAKE